MLLFFQSYAHAGNVFNGKKVYQQYCQDCHGKTGEGLSPIMPDFSRGEKLFVDNSLIKQRVETGIRSMPGFSSLLEEDEIDDVIAYIRTFM